MDPVRRQRTQHDSMIGTTEHPTRAAAHRWLIAPTSNRALEAALRQRLEDSRRLNGTLGDLEPLALRLGLVFNSLRPAPRHACLIVFAADHGVATAADAAGAAALQSLLDGRLAPALLAAEHGLELLVVDCGLARPLAARDHVLVRAGRRATHDSRTEPSMSLEEAYAALRAGLTLGEELQADAFACTALGNGADESAALVIARLSDRPVHEFLPQAVADGTVAARRDELGAVHRRHGALRDPAEVLAAVGGFETATLAGFMLAAAGRRRLLIPDGLPACAALLAATGIAPTVAEYAVHARSRASEALDRTLALFENRAVLELGLDGIDGAGACLAWPLIRSAAALLRGPSR
jgi:nicotinate-nucleotide--dimethylbenzimidazole phosphoribosyltransferase